MAEDHRAPLVVAPSGQLAAVRAIKAGFAELQMDTMTVAVEFPAKPPAEFVLVSRIHSDTAPFSTDTVGVLVECYAVTRGKAEQLANRARASLDWAAGDRTSGIIWWRESSRPVEFSNPDVAQHVRFQFMGTLSVVEK